jgi:glycosyltransferase involved in cell wall biosynthesis
LVHRLGRLLYGKYVDVKFAPSDLAAKYTFGNKAYESGKVKILHNAVDLEIFSYKADGRKKLRDEFGVSDNTVVVGHVGRFMTQKNHLFLLDIFDNNHFQHKLVLNHYKLLLFHLMSFQFLNQKELQILKVEGEKKSVKLI